MNKKILCGILAALTLVFSFGCAPNKIADPNTPTTQNPEFQVPIYEDANILGLLNGVDTRFTKNYSFTNNRPLSHFKGDPTLRFTSSGAVSKSDHGISASADMWNSIGFTDEITQKYTAEARLYNYGSSTSVTSAIMFGTRLKSAGHLFIDSGLWLSVNNSNAHLLVHNVFSVSLGTNLGFDSKQGVNVRFEDSGKEIKIFVNDIFLAIVDINGTNNTIIVRDANGTHLKTASASNIAHNGTLGYIRTMQHFADSAVASISICEGEILEYSPTNSFTMLKKDFCYFLSDKTQYKCNSPIIFKDSVILMDAKSVADLFGFEYTAQDNTATLSRDRVILSFTAGEHVTKVNGRSVPFPTIIKENNIFLIAVDYIARWMRYTVKTEAERAFITAGEEKITEQKIFEAEERYKLYQDVIYNYGNVTADQTGVGLYEKTPCEDRLVGIAYTTWHAGSTNTWSDHSWDVPLDGAYLSDNTDVIYKHGILLRDAGVDFVFVDWTNNTNYDRSSTNPALNTFRMIEYATDLLFEVWSTIEGSPRICIFTGPGHQGIESVNNGNHQKKVDQIYRDYVEKYPDMYFNYDGKPLLMCYGATPNQYTSTPSWNDSRFTVRWVTGYVGQQGSLYNKGTLMSNGFWSWEERGAQTYTVTADGRVECITCTASSRQQSTEGAPGYIAACGREDGATLKKQFQRANDLGAGIVILVSWNEWNKGEQPSAEISKDLEPSQIHGTFYYDLLCEQIKKFKGKV